MEPCKKATTYLEDLENQKGPADHTDHHENLDHQILRLECIVSLHGHRMGEKEVPLLKYAFHVGGNSQACLLSMREVKWRFMRVYSTVQLGIEEVQTSENHNDDGGDEKEDHDFEPSTDEESNEDLQKIHLMRIWMDI
ncbi:hypothetical protein Tco_1017604 [Tanacetum coccineum]|uniref:Uncharacterized protein n=1 Tax=Tanacetum coccineum TaxID=301880 RepID=A0ABQ5FT22_9ASTR